MPANFGPLALTTVDPDFKRTYNIEATAGIQHELLPRVSVGATGTGGRSTTFGLATTSCGTPTTVQWTWDPLDGRSSPCTTWRRPKCAGGDLRHQCDSHRAGLQQLGAFGDPGCLEGRSSLCAAVGRPYPDGVEKTPAGRHSDSRTSAIKRPEGRPFNDARSAEWELPAASVPALRSAAHSRYSWCGLSTRLVADHHDALDADRTGRTALRGHWFLRP